MDIEQIDSWLETHKHLTGRHNQKRHGWRFGNALAWENAKNRLASGHGISSDFEGKTTPEAEAEAMRRGGPKGVKKYGGMLAPKGDSAARKFLSLIKDGVYGTTRQEVMDGLKNSIESTKRQHEDFLKRAADMESGKIKDSFMTPNHLRQQAAPIMGNINGMQHILSRMEKGKDYLQDIWGNKTPIEFGGKLPKARASKPTKAPKPKGNSSKVDPGMAREALRMAKGDKQAAYSRVVQMTGLKPGFDAKDLMAFFNENGM